MASPSRSVEWSPPRESLAGDLVLDRTLLLHRLSGDFSEPASLSFDGRAGDDELEFDFDL